LDFSANINPVQAVDLSCLLKVQLTPYADPDYGMLKQAIRRRYPTPAGVGIELFNGASAAIFACCAACSRKTWFYIRLCMVNMRILPGAGL